VLVNAAGVVQVNAHNAGVLISSFAYYGAGTQLDVIGGGSATLNPNDYNLAVTLSQAGTLTLSNQGFITATGSDGRDTIVAPAAFETLTGGAGADTLVGATHGGDTFRDTAAGLNGDTIVNFAGKYDKIDITNFIPGSHLGLSYTPDNGQGTLTVSEGAQSTSITLIGNFSSSSFAAASDGHGGVFITLH
jgi:hypothetical protein